MPLLLVLAPLSLAAQNPVLLDIVLVEKRDSAGIAIVESKLSGSPPRARLTVDSAAILTLAVAPTDTGVDAGAARFTRIGGARVMRSGAIVVGDDAAARLHFFSRYGVPGRTAGGPSDSVGNLTSVRILDLRGDTVVVCCSPGVALFSSSGNFLIASAPFRGEMLGYVPNGRYLVRRTSSETFAYQGQKGVVKTLLMDTLFLADTRGNVGARIAVLPSRIHVSVFNPDPNPLGLPITYIESPFEPESHYVTTRSGFVYTDGRTVEVRTYAATGRLTRIARLQLAPPDLTPQLVQSYRQTVLRKYTVIETRRYIEWVLGQYVTPETLPMVRALRVGSDGRVWMREHAFPAKATATWHVFSTDGSYEGTVSMPASWRVHQIDADVMLVSEQLPNGSAMVSLHQVSAAAGSRR
jgi:hypothetical protein